MKTKYLLTAMLLPAAFAACTNEDVLVENPNVLEDRPVVDFKVAATYGAEGTESRMENKNGTFLWENTDVLGAVWNQNQYVNGLGTQAYKIYTNNKFVNSLTTASASADFTTDATTVVGDYVFYYPYNTDVTKDLNSGIVYSLPEPQEYDPTGDKMMNNNFMISPNITVDGNEPGELTLPLTMRSIYGYGTLNIALPGVFVINDEEVNSVNIQKIIIEYTSNVYKDGKINLANIPAVDLSAETIEDLIAGEYTSGNMLTLYGADLVESCEGKTEAEVRSILFAAADKKLVASADEYSDGDILGLTSGTNYIGQVSIACVSTENPNGVALAKGQTFSTRVLLPTTDDAGANVNISVYTDKGKFVIPQINNARIKANHTANLANVNRILGGEEKITLSSSWCSAISSVDAINEADFIATVKTLTTNTTVKVGDFSLTPAAIAAIPSTVKLTFATPVTFEGDMTLKNMTFSGAVSLKSGKIVLGTDLSATTINVDGAEATIAATVANTPAMNVNSGSMDIAAVDEDGEAVATSLGAVNVGSVDDEGEPVAATLKVTNDLTTTSTVTVKAESTLDNAATINDLSVEEDAIVNNAGIIKELTANAGTINNAGTITNGNNAEVINQMEGGKILALTNTGKIVTVAKSETTVTSNTGEVVYVEGARVNATSSGLGAVNYIAPSTFAEGDFASLNSSVTKVTFETAFTTTKGVDLTTANSNITALEFKSDLNITTEKTLNLNANTILSFTGATSVVKGGSITGTGITIIVGVADSDEDDDIDDSVNTDVEIKKGTTIATVTGVTFNTTKAQVWNDGTVTGGVVTYNYPQGTTAADNAGWKSNAIN